MDWGGRLWELVLDDAMPGLRAAEGPSCVLLGLGGVGAMGRIDGAALGGSSLAKVEVVRSRVEATYVPPNWKDLRVRASWSPCEDDAGVDLEIQVAADSVGELKDLEVYLAMRPDSEAMEAPSGVSLMSAPLILRPRGSTTAKAYVEFVHPDDSSRGVVASGEGGTPPSGTTTALFGHDLEKGVVIRGRIRGLWLPTDDLDAWVRAAWHRFLAAPPPLGM